MEYDEFIEKIIELIGRRLGNSYKVEGKHIIKNNSVELDGIVIMEKNMNISPNIYLDSYYKKYKKGNDIERISEDIISVYYNSIYNDEIADIDLDFSFTSVSERIIYKLVNYEKNKVILNSLPYIRILDLAVTFHVLMKNSSFGISTVRITNEHVDFWNTCTEELLKFSNNNTPRIFPAVIRCMNEIILELLQNDSQNLLNSDIDINEEMLENMEEIMKSEKKREMYVLSNSNGINGASAMLYINTLKEFATEKNTDFYILPSSIHEVILIPYTNGLSKNELDNMVAEVNISQVPQEDILSNQAYIYRRHNNSFEF